MILVNFLLTNYTQPKCTHFHITIPISNRAKRKWNQKRLSPEAVLLSNSMFTDCWRSIHQLRTFEGSDLINALSTCYFLLYVQFSKWKEKKWHSLVNHEFFSPFSFMDDDLVHMMHLCSCPQTDFHLHRSMLVGISIF